MANIGAVQSAEVNSSGLDTTVLAAVGGRSMKVVGYCISASINSVIRMEDGVGGTVLARHNMGSRNFCTVPFASTGWFRTSPGNLLNLNVSTGTIQGHVLFVEE